MYSRERERERCEICIVLQPWISPVVWLLNFYMLMTCGTHAWSVYGGLGGCGVSNNYV